MADTQSAATDTTPRITRDSFCTRKFNITNFEHNPKKWNGDWEKVLRTLSSADVYATMGRLLSKISLLRTDAISELHQRLKETVLSDQSGLTRLWDELLGEKFEYFKMAWLLLDEKERTRHLLKGVEEGIQRSWFGQDTRALCPDITVSAMSKQRGVPFTDFLNNYQEKMREVTVGDPYLVANEWWDKAPQDVQSETFPASTFEILTLSRNDFIVLFVVHTTMSIMNDLVNGSPGMDPVKELIDSNGLAASGWSHAMANMRDKPIIRCENCTKSPEEIQSNGKFMVCSACRSKLGFTIHYCSQSCQKEDWNNHKKHCGKKKVSKKLSGTVHDPFWAHPEVPEYLRDSSFVSKGGHVDLTSIGFPGPNTTCQYTPALQRQISALTADKITDYYLFDEADNPVPIVLFEMWEKMLFRHMRLGAWSGQDPSYMASMAQYLIKHWGSRPGLSRERILKQFEREYGEGTTAEIEDFERKGVERGHGEDTFFDIMSRGMRSMPIPT